MITTLTILSLLSSALASADSPPADASPEPMVSAGETMRGVDIEVDPLAYAFGGASIHGGLHLGPVRFDLGVFSLVLPEFLHGNPGFTAQGHGYGVKADWFLREAHTGFHVGAQVDLTRQTVTRDATGESELYRELATGGRVGYRLQHTSGLYVDPWIGLIYRVTSPTEIDLGGETYEQSKVTPFPTVHVGWRL